MGDYVGEYHMKILGLSKGVTRSLDYGSFQLRGYGSWWLCVAWVGGRGGGLLVEGLRD